MNWPRNNGAQGGGELRTSQRPRNADYTWQHHCPGMALSVFPTFNIQRSTLNIQPPTLDVGGWTLNVERLAKGLDPGQGFPLRRQRSWSQLTSHACRCSIPTNLPTPSLSPAGGCVFTVVGTVSTPSLIWPTSVEQASPGLRGRGPKPSELRAGLGRVRGVHQAQGRARPGLIRDGVETVPSALGSEHAQRVKVPHRRSFPPGN